MNRNREIILQEIEKCRLIRWDKIRLTNEISIEIFITSFLFTFETISPITLYIVQSLQKSKRKQKERKVGSVWTNLRNLCINIIPSFNVTQRCVQRTRGKPLDSVGMKGGSSESSQLTFLFALGAPPDDGSLPRKEASSRDIVHGRGRLDN